MYNFFSLHKLQRSMILEVKKVMKHKCVYMFTELQHRKCDKLWEVTRSNFRTQYSKFILQNWGGTGWALSRKKPNHQLFNRYSLATAFDCWLTNEKKKKSKTSIGKTGYNNSNRQNTSNNVSKKKHGTEKTNFDKCKVKMTNKNIKFPDF